MLRTESRLLPNHFIARKYNDDKYTVVLFKHSIQNSGYEEDEERELMLAEFDEDYKKNDVNISRTRTRVWEYSTCNDFQYFVTLTLDKNKLNRYDLELFISKLGQFIRNNRKSTGSDIQYILIPEQHQDGAWHMHGLINGIREEELKPFTLNDNIPMTLKNLIRAGRTIFSWEKYEKKFGWVTLEKIQNKEAVSKYITKYIKKDIGIAVSEKNKKSYYVTRGLKLSEVTKKGTFPTAIRNALQPDYENQFLYKFHMNKEQYESFLSQL